MKLFVEAARYEQIVSVPLMNGSVTLAEFNGFEEVSLGLAPIPVAPHVDESQGRVCLSKSGGQL